MTSPPTQRPRAIGQLSSNPSYRGSAYFLIVLAVTSVLLMMMHPTTGTHNVADFVAKVGRGVPGNTFVHGSLITLTLLMAVCLVSLRDMLGAHRWLVRAGTTSLIVGSAGAVAAGLVNGFILPNTVSHFIDAGADQLPKLEPVLALARETNATLARVAMVGLSLSAVAWSICLVQGSGLPRFAGVVGLICGITPLGLHAAEHLQMNVPGFSLFVQIHAVWACIAGVVLAHEGTASLKHTATKDVHQ